MDMMRFYLQDVCITSCAGDTALTMFAKSVNDLITKANNVLKRLEVFEFKFAVREFKEDISTDIL